MAETSVKYKATADVRELKTWTASVIEGARALDKMTDAQRRNDAATSTTGGGSAGAGGTAPPAPSPATPADAAPTLPAPAPSPASPAAPGGWSPSWSTPPGSSVPWHTPPPIPSPVAPGGAAPGGGAPSPSPAGGSAGGSSGPSPFMARVRSGVSTGLGMGVGMALGGSALGFLFSAGEQFMEVDRILGQLQQRFGKAGGDVRGFGADLGYTVEQAAELATVLGSVENSFSGSTARRYTGFARVRGLDPSQTVGQLATIGRVSGGVLGNAALSGILGGASAVGMGRGRLSEYLGVLSEMMQQQQAVMGEGDFRSQQRNLGMINSAFGGKDIGTGRNAQDIAGRLQGVMTGGGLNTFLMRAMGYGSDPNLGYVEMRKRMEAGINDPRNLTSLFETFQKRGYSTDQMFRVMESVSGGSMRAVEIDALVKQLGTKEGLDAYNKGETAVAMPGTDFGKAGAGTVRRGEARAVQLEAMKLDIGDTVSEMMNDLTGAAMNLMDATKALTGTGLSDAITGLTGWIEYLSGWIKYAAELFEGFLGRGEGDRKAGAPEAKPTPPGQRTTMGGMK